MPKKKNWVDRVFPSSKKNQDNIKLLFSDVAFNERLKEIRAFLDLPKKGFDTEAEDYEQQYEEWEDAMLQKCEEIMHSDAFQSILKKYREQFDKHEISYWEYKDLCYKHHDIVPINYLTRQSKRLTDEFNVPVNYKDSIRHYILTNTISLIPATPFTEMRGTEDDWNERSIALTFYSKITNRDLKLVKKAVNERFGSPLPSLDPLKDLDTKLAIETYHRDRDVTDPYEQESYRLTAKEIAENIEQDTGKKIKPNDVYEVIRALREQRNKRFRKSGKE